MKFKKFLLSLIFVSLTACGARQSQNQPQDTFFYWLAAIFFCTYVAFSVGKSVGQLGTNSSRISSLISLVVSLVIAALAWTSPVMLQSTRHAFATYLKQTFPNNPSDETNALLIGRYGIPTMIVFYSLGYSNGRRNYIYQGKEKRESENLAAKLRCPPEIESYMRKAEELIHKEEYEAAIEQLKEAIRISPTSAVAHNNLGAALVNLKNFDDAEKEYLEALELSVSDPYAPHPYQQAKSNLGRLRGYTEKAKKNLRDDMQTIVKAYRKK